MGEVNSFWGEINLFLKKLILKFTQVLKLIDDNLLTIESFLERKTTSGFFIFKI